jgi:hypothetical protein
MGKVFVLGWRRSAEGAALKISEAEWQKPSSSSDNDSDPHPGRPPELDLKSDWKRYLNLPSVEHRRQIARFCGVSTTTRMFAYRTTLRSAVGSTPLNN